MTFTLPTLLTLFRIFLIPVFVICFYWPSPWSHSLATAVFALASFTDWVDGYLARALNQESRFGAFLDPVADKLMVAVAIILLVQAHPNAWMVIPSMIIISREIAVSALREWMAELGSRGEVKVNFIGKVKTTAQLVSLMLLIYAEDVWGLPTYTFGMVLYYLSAVLTLYSMVLYLKAAWPYLTDES